MVDPTQTKQKEPSPRRRFLTRLWISLGIVAFLQILAGSLFFLVSGRQRREENITKIIDAGPVLNFPPGSMTLISKGHLYLSRLDDGGFLAISRKCTHLGCAVPWIEERKQFECPCHASFFDKTGNVIKAPAARALDLYRISFVNKSVIIDIGNPIRRDVFSAEQVMYPREQT